jgi:hypothetical protein
MSTDYNMPFGCCQAASTIQLMLRVQILSQLGSQRVTGNAQAARILALPTPGEEADPRVQREVQGFS